MRGFARALGLATIAVMGQPIGPAAAVPVGSDTSSIRPLIVDGQITSSYPSTGALLLYDDSRRTSLSGLCSGTLIGCHTVLTAAHCVCPDTADSAAGCPPGQRPDPSTMQVFFQHAGLLDVASVDIDPAYHFMEGGDVAVITLAQPATGITPSAINSIRKPPNGTRGTIVGFGTTGTDPRRDEDAGVKREGEVTTVACTDGVPDATHVCWRFSGVDSSTCHGDSGGPLFVDLGSGPLLAGVTSGGTSGTCTGFDLSFDTDVFVHRAWIMEASGDDLGTASCGLPPVGSSSTTEVDGSGVLTLASVQAQFDFNVPSGTSLLRVALNGAWTGPGLYGAHNEFTLFVRAGSPPTRSTFDCTDTNGSTFGACEISAPTPGHWYVSVQRKAGTGTYQATATTFHEGAPAPCTGDCNGDGAVSVDELLAGVNITLGNAALSTCPSFDASGDGAVTVDELLAAVGGALSGCPAP